MAYLITKDGTKINVDIDNTFISEKAVILDDNAILKDVWILNLYRREKCSLKDPPELIQQIVLDAEPTKEQIIYRMSENGLSRFDVVTIEKGYTLDFE